MRSTSDNSMVISKSDFLLWRECAKNAWMKIHRPNIFYAAKLSDFEISIIETGNEVEAVARKLFPFGILVEGRDQASKVKTLELIAAKTPAIFQGVFDKEGFFAATDVLKYDEVNDRYELYEIKATNSVDKKLHLPDLAFQSELLTRCGIEIRTTGVIHLNPDYVREGELNPAKLFMMSDVTESIDNMREAIRAEMERALTYLNAEKEPPGPCTCIFKGRSSHCATFSYSNPHIPEYSVHDIARIGLSKAKLIELIDGNVYELQNIPESIELSEIQRNQVNAHITGRPIVRIDKIAEELRSLIFPLYFLDYETFPSALPRFDSFSPYQQIPFQYSLHIVESPDKEPVHFEFLHEGKDDPSPHLAAQLSKDIGKIGTVVTWNKKFESGRNEELGQRLPQFKGFFGDVNSRIYDLMDIFSKQYHVHKDYKGSTSIKYVLPVLAPELKYDDLEIKEGGTASQKWNIMTTGDMSVEERSKIATNLKTYCKLDTYAMYRIWKYLQKLSLGI